MNEKRIYGDKYEIDTLRTKELYNARADRLGNMKSPYTSVLLGDQNPEYADEWNVVEKDLILPFMQADKTKSVLDLGCGIGRWAESLLPLCENYTGVDFSEEKAKEILLEKEIEIIVTLGSGQYESCAWGCDLTYDYVKINGDYRS